MLRVIPFLLMLLGLVAEIAYYQGREAERAESECSCGEARPCAFAAGIVGFQECGVWRKWKSCEPDPRYKIGGL